MEILNTDTSESPYIYTVLVLCGLGILLNIYGGIVFCCNRMRYPLRRLLIGLALEDITMCALTMALFIPMVFFHEPNQKAAPISPSVIEESKKAEVGTQNNTTTGGDGKSIGDSLLESWDNLPHNYFLPYFYTLLRMCHTVIIWSIIPLSILALCAKPPKGKVIISLLIVELLAIAYNICRYWEVKLVDGRLQRGFLLDQWEHRRLYEDIYYQWAFWATHYMLPILVMLILWIVYCVVWCRSSDEYEPLAKDYRKLVIAVQVIFLITNTPIFALYLNYVILEKDKANTGIILVGNQYTNPSAQYKRDFSGICNILTALNSVLKPIFYIIISRAWRRAACCCCCKGEDPHSNEAEAAGLLAKNV